MIGTGAEWTVEPVAKVANGTNKFKIVCENLQHTAVTLIYILLKCDVNYKLICSINILDSLRKWI